jgi:Spy/CpxP family protein refolding chaperone
LGLGGFSALEAILLEVDSSAPLGASIMEPAHRIMNRPTFDLKRSLFSFALAAAVLTAGGTLAAIAIGSVPAAFAQDQPSGGPPADGHHGNRMGEVLKSLNLTDAQKTQIRAIIADARKQNQNVTDRDQRRANMKAAMGKVEAVLTPAQRTELHAKMDAMHQQNQAPHS